MGRKAFVGMTLCGLSATLLAPATASAQQDRVSATEKGSLVIFSKVEIRWDDAGFLLQDTFLQLTNDNNEDVKVQMYFINGDAPLEQDGNERAHPGWNWLDNEITLTANQPTYWSALTGQPANGGLSPFTALDPGFPPGRPCPDGSGDRCLRGYIVGWAVNSENQEIRWNHLKGEGTLVNYDLGYAWEYNSYNHAVVSGVPEGQPSDGNPGVLNMDGAEYSPGFAQLLMNFQAVTSAAFSGPLLVVSDTDLTLLPESADLRQETDGPVTTKANFDVWNMNEVKFSGAHRCVTCWDQTLLSDYDLPNHFLLQNLQTDHGKARIDGLESQVCDVDFDPDNNDDFPFPPGPLDPVDDRDVISEAAALLGVVVKLLDFDMGEDFGAAGTNLIGMGFENATIQYDTSGGPPEGQQDEVEVPTTTGGWMSLIQGLSGKASKGQSRN